MTRGAPLRSNFQSYDNYYNNQVGNGLPVFYGGKNYRGGGIGNLLAGLGRIALPLLKTGGKALLKESVNSGVNVIKDVLSGQSVASSLKTRSKEAGKRLFERALGRTTGTSPTKKKRINPQSRINPRQKKKRQRNKKKETDIFS